MVRLPTFRVRDSRHVSKCPLLVADDVQNYLNSVTTAKTSKCVTKGGKSTGKGKDEELIKQVVLICKTSKSVATCIDCLMH